MLDIEERHGVAVLHMRRHSGANRLDAELLQRITAALEFVGTDRGVVLTGYGSIFAIDSEAPPTDDLSLAKRAALAAIRGHRAPVVAAINGDALDTGFELAAAADVRLMCRGRIGTRRAVLTAAEAAAIGLVERSFCPAGLLDEAIQRAVQVKSGRAVRTSPDSTTVGG